MHPEVVIFFISDIWCLEPQDANLTDKICHLTDFDLISRELGKFLYIVGPIL